MRNACDRMIARRQHRPSMQSIQFIAVVCAAFLANFAGGAFARRVTDSMHLARGFSAGTVIAVAFFVFLPQAVLSDHTAHAIDALLPLAGLGFVIALLLDRFASLGSPDNQKHHSARKHYGHAVLNGAAIGVAYGVSPMLSGVVTAALLVHEFSDSADTMTPASRIGYGSSVLRKSFISSLCVAMGLAAAYFAVLPPGMLSVALALFGGYFAYLSASDLIPETHHAHPQLLTVAMTFGGAGGMYLASLAVL
jgi:zinc and cadmium transporter